MPGHLNRFQNLFVGFFRVVLEIGQGDDPRMQVGKSYGQRICSRVFFDEPDRDIFCVLPFQVHVQLLASGPLPNYFPVAESQSCCEISETFFPSKLRLSESSSKATDSGLAACSRSAIRARIAFASLPSAAALSRESLSRMAAASSCPMSLSPSASDFSVVVMRAPASSRASMSFLASTSCCANLNESSIIRSTSVSDKP